MNYIYTVVNFINIDIVFTVTTLSKGINIFRQNLARRGIEKTHSWLVLLLSLVLVRFLLLAGWFRFFYTQVIDFL